MRSWKLFVLCAVLVALAGGGVARANHIPYALGDVFVASNGGKVGHFDSLGNLLEVLDTTDPAGVERGMCFDSSGQLYATNFEPQPGSVSQFDTQGGLVTNAWATAFLGSPESCVFDAAGNAYVGEVDGENLLGGALRLFDPSGTALGPLMPDVDQRGVDWIDLAADQCTVFYTSEGTDIKRFDACFDSQLSDFATVPLIDDSETQTSHHCFALRIRENDEVVVACSTTVVDVCNSGFVFRLNPDGSLNSTYPVPDCLFAANLDPDGTHVWTAGRDSGNVFKIDLDTGAGAATPVFNSAAATPPAGTTPLSPVIGGLLISSGLPVVAPDITLVPPTAENPAGTSHTVTATVTSNGSAVEGILVSFEVTAGPNIGEVSDPGECAANTDCTTDAAGQTSWTYTSNGQAGVDTIRACVTDSLGDSYCAEATKEWVVASPPPEITLVPPTAENPTGTSHTVTATVTAGGSPVEGILVSFEVTAGPNVGEVSDPGECMPNTDCTTDAAGQTSWTYTSNGQVGLDTIRACVMDSLGEPHCAEAMKQWVVANAPPDCTGAVAGILQVWPPNHKFVPVSILGVRDPDGDATTTTIVSIHQDEPVLQVGTGSGNTCPDGMGIGTSSASVRAERDGNPKVPGDGRVYHIGFTASDGTATCEGEVTLCVPHDQGKGRGCVDEGPLFDSTVCTRTPGPPAASAPASKAKSKSK